MRDLVGKFKLGTEKPEMSCTIFEHYSVMGSGRLWAGDLKKVQNASVQGENLRYVSLIFY